MQLLVHAFSKEARTESKGTTEECGIAADIRYTPLARSDTDELSRIDAKWHWYVYLDMHTERFKEESAS